MRGAIALIPETTKEVLMSTYEPDPERENAEAVPEPDTMPEDEPGVTPPEPQTLPEEPDLTVPDAAEETI